MGASMDRVYDKCMECQEFHVNQDLGVSLWQTCDVFKTNIPFFNSNNRLRARVL